MSNEVQHVVERTFRTSPQGDACFGDGPGTWVEVVIDASLEVVWESVTDLNLPARFSTEFLGASWTGDGPALGASFIGRNFHEAIGEWELKSFVDAFEPRKVFGWATADPEAPGARWRFRLTPELAGTRLRFEVELGPGKSGTTMAIASMPDKEAKIIHRRIGELNANMRNTIHGIRDLLESGAGP